MSKDNTAKTQKDLSFNYVNSRSVYTDAIEINVSDGIVMIGLATKNKDNDSANVSHRAYMTYSTFISLAQACANTVNSMETEILKKNVEEK